EATVFVHIVVGSPQSASDHLLTQQLRHERSQPDNMRDRVAVPSFSKHSNAYDTAHITSRRMERTLQFLCQIFEPFRVDGASLFIGRPIYFADGVEGNPHPPRFVALGLASIRLVDNFRVDTDGISYAVSVQKSFDLC